MANIASPHPSRFKDLIDPIWPGSVTSGESCVTGTVKDMVHPRLGEEPETRQVELTIENDKIDRLYGELDKLETDQETVLYGSKSYESLLAHEGPSVPWVPAIRRHGPLEAEDLDNNLSYEVSSPSPVYQLFLLEMLSQANLLENLSTRRIHNAAAHPRGLDEDEPDLLDAIGQGIPHAQSLKIMADRSTRLSRFQELGDAFRFQLSYNLDFTFIEIKFLDEIVRSKRLSRIRRSEIDELDPPRRTYTSDLIYHYQMGSATDSPLLQFISYYHVMEHYFEEVYRTHLADLLREEITRPSFSYKRQQDLHDLVSLLEKRIRVRGEDLSFNEQEALFLTLSQNVDIERVVNELTDFDETLVDYYARESVEFSGGQVVDLRRDDDETLMRKLAERIYSTRNAVVHSKNTDKPKYQPFLHDKQLHKEIPLLRFLAEELVISKSRPL